MKQRVATVGVLAFVLLGSTVQTASAFSKTHGTAFHAYNASEVTSIDYVIAGVRNIAASPRSVIAPVSFNPPDGWAGGVATFRVEGKCAAGTTINYTMYGLNEAGVIQSSQNILQGASPFSTFVQLSNLSVASYVSLLGTLPANTGTQFFGVLSVL